MRGESGLRWVTAFGPRSHILVIVHELVDYSIWSFLGRSGPTDRVTFPFESHVVVAMPWVLKQHVLPIHAQFEARRTLWVRH